MKGEEIPHIDVLLSVLREAWVAWKKCWCNQHSPRRCLPASLGWIYSTSKIRQMSSCFWGHVPTFELGATSWQWQQPRAVRVVAANSFEVLPFSYLLLHAACDTWVCVLQLSPFKSAGVWSNAGHPRERGKSWTKCSSSIKPLECQCRVWFPATFSSKTDVLSELFNRKEQRQLSRSASQFRFEPKGKISNGIKWFVRGTSWVLGRDFSKLQLPFRLLS